MKDANAYFSKSVLLIGFERRGRRQDPGNSPGRQDIGEQNERPEPYDLRKCSSISIMKKRKYRRGVLPVSPDTLAVRRQRP